MRVKTLTPKESATQNDGQELLRFHKTQHQTSPRRLSNAVDRSHGQTTFIYKAQSCHITTQQPFSERKSQGSAKQLDIWATSHAAVRTLPIG